MVHQNKDYYESDALEQDFDDYYYEEDYNDTSIDSYSDNNYQTQEVEIRNDNETQNKKSITLKEWLGYTEILLVKDTLWKVISTILAFIWVLNIFSTWFGSEKLPGVKSKNDTKMRLLWTVFAVLFWIPGIVISLRWIWVENK